MEAPITITHRQLYSIAPEVRAQTREVLSGKRVAITTEKAREVQFLDADELTAEEALPDTGDVFESINSRRDEQFTRDMPATFATVAIAPVAHSSEPLIVPDPYEVYLRKFPAGHPPDTLIVAKESSALRSILPLVDNHLRVESIMDPGCQIIAMSEEVCHALGLAYDPDVVLNMQSANGEVDKSLGLARNVPFKIGDVTVYLQVHVIRSPAYDILLGRPFDVLTESVVRNFANEEQTITIRDPNSGANATVPTYAQGTRRFAHRATDVTGFRNSGI
jgi:hypothetical protein